MGSKEYVYEYFRSMGARFAESLQKETGELTDTQIIDSESYIPDFDPKAQYLNWDLGSVVRDDGQVWTLIQKYNSETYPQPPKEMRAQWGLLHTKNPEKAKPFVAPLGVSGVYMKGECVLEGEKVYRCKVDNNVYSPTEYPRNWEVVS